MNYDTPRQYLNFNRTIFFILVLVRRHMTFKNFRCSTFGKWILWRSCNLYDYLLPGTCVVLDGRCTAVWPWPRS